MTSCMKRYLTAAFVVTSMIFSLFVPTVTSVSNQIAYAEDGYENWVMDKAKELMEEDTDDDKDSEEIREESSETKAEFTDPRNIPEKKKGHLFSGYIKEYFITVKNLIFHPIATIAPLKSIGSFSTRSLAVTSVVLLVGRKEEATATIDRGIQEIQTEERTGRPIVLAVRIGKGGATLCNSSGRPCFVI